MLLTSACDASKSGLLSTATGVTPRLPGLMGLTSLPGLTSIATWIVGGVPAPKATLSTPTTLLPGTVRLIRVMGSSDLTPQKTPRLVQGDVADPSRPFAPQIWIEQVPLRKYVTRSAPTAPTLPPVKLMTNASP